MIELNNNIHSKAASNAIELHRRLEERRLRLGGQKIDRLSDYLLR